MSREEKEKRKEFRDVVDLNKDGKATRKEVLVRIIIIGIIIIIFLYKN